METHGIPNDVIVNLNPITVIIFLPIIQQLLYPSLEKVKVNFGPISRITVDFVLEVLALAYAAGIQKLIYTKGPCYSTPLKCASSQHGTLPNHIHVMFQTPIYVLDGVAEIFFDITSQEYAYTQAPNSMKSLVQAVLVLTAALGAAIGFALSPLYKNPTILGLYSGLSGAMFVTSVCFFVCLRRYNEKDRGESLDERNKEFVARPAVRGEIEGGEVELQAREV